MTAQSKPKVYGTMPEKLPETLPIGAVYQSSCGRRIACKTVAKLDLGDGNAPAIRSVAAKGTFSKADIKTIRLAIYGAKAALPTGGEAWSAHVDAHAVEVVTSAVESYAAVARKAHSASIKMHIPAAKRELAAVAERAPGSVSEHNARDRLCWHEKRADRYARDIRRYLRILKSITEHGLPPEAFE